MKLAKPAEREQGLSTSGTTALCRLAGAASLFVHCFRLSHHLPCRPRIRRCAAGRNRVAASCRLHTLSTRRRRQPVTPPAAAEEEGQAQGARLPDRFSKPAAVWRAGASHTLPPPLCGSGRRPPATVRGCSLSRQNETSTLDLTTSCLPHAGGPAGEDAAGMHRCGAGAQGLGGGRPAVGALRQRPGGAAGHGQVLGGRAGGGMGQQPLRSTSIATCWSLLRVMRVSSRRVALHCTPSPACTPLTPAPPTPTPPAASSCARPRSSCAWTLTHGGGSSRRWTMPGGLAGEG